MKKIVLYFIISLSLFFVPQLSYAQGGIWGKIVKTISKYNDDVLSLAKRTYSIYRVSKNIHERFNSSNVNINYIKWNSPVYTGSLKIDQSAYKFQPYNIQSSYHGSFKIADLMKYSTGFQYVSKNQTPSSTYYNFKLDPFPVREFISIDDLKQNFRRIRVVCRFEVLKWPKRRIVLPKFI